jgi:hypothetical protein
VRGLTIGEFISSVFHLNTTPPASTAFPNVSMKGCTILPSEDISILRDGEELLVEWQASVFVSGGGGGVSVLPLPVAVAAASAAVLLLPLPVAAAAPTAAALVAPVNDAPVNTEAASGAGVNAEYEVIEINDSDDDDGDVVDETDIDDAGVLAISAAARRAFASAAARRAYALATTTSVPISKSLKRARDDESLPLTVYTWPTTGVTKRSECVWWGQAHLGVGPAFRGEFISVASERGFLSAIGTGARATRILPDISTDSPTRFPLTGFVRDFVLDGCPGCEYHVWITI